MVAHRLTLGGLETGQSYFYKASARRGIEVVSETDVTPFRTPHVAVSARPTRLDIKKDGDTDADVSIGGVDIVESTNKGEARFTWTVRLDPKTDVWPEMEMLHGCYPHGGSVTIGMDEGTKIPIPGLGPEQPGGTTHEPPPPGDPPPGEPPHASTPAEGCLDEAMLGPGGEVKPDTTKVKSGQEIHLSEPGIQWELPDGVGGGPPPGSPGFAASGPPTVADEEGSVETGSSGPGTSGGGSPPPQTCEGLAPAEAHVPIHVTVRGYEYDKLTEPFSGQEIAQLRRQTASERDVVCFDLRDRDQTLMLGVNAENGNFEFTIWFEVALVYVD